MAALQDAEIKGAIRKIQTGSAKRVTLKDGYGRGGGRLALMIRPAKHGVTAEWYATQHMNGKRTLAKIGVYPQLTLADARSKFTGYSLRIREGISVKRKQATGDTFEAMLKGYCASLDNERVRRQRELALLESSGCAADFIGRNRRACEVTTSEVVDWLRTFHQRGAIVQADNVRAHLSAAFNWAMGSENDYRQANSANWNIVINPVAAIPADPNADRASERFLPPDEFKKLLRWLGKQTKPAAKCLHVLALTGQRIEEISTLKPAQFDGKTLDWAKTKNGKPHCIPVPKQAAKILSSLPPSMFGSPSYRVVRDVIAKFCAETKVAKFTTKDLRRTWKTLAGEAGISKADRDLIQNHSKGDVSSKHYDRYEYIAEKKAAMDKWSDWVARHMASDGDGGLKADGS